MFGSPGIATNIGAFREVIDGKNGIMISNNRDYKEIHAAFKIIETNFESFSAAARNTYLEQFDFIKHVQLMKEILLEVIA